MKTLKTKHGIKIDVRSIDDFDDNAEIVEFGNGHYSSGAYVEGFQVDMVVEAMLADGTSESFTICCQSADTSDKLRAHGRTTMQFAKHFGADWDHSGELEEFVEYEDWDEIEEFLIGLAEDKCQEWYDAHKDERFNKSRGKKSKKESRVPKASMQKKLESLRRGKKSEGAAREYTSRIDSLVEMGYLTMEAVAEFFLRAFSEDTIKQAYGWMVQDELIPSESQFADDGLEFNDDGDLVSIDSDESYRRAHRAHSRLR